MILDCWISRLAADPSGALNQPNGSGWVKRFGFHQQRFCNTRMQQALPTPANTRVFSASGLFQHLPLTDSSESHFQPSGCQSNKLRSWHFKCSLSSLSTCAGWWGGNDIALPGCSSSAVKLGVCRGAGSPRSSGTGEPSHLFPHEWRFKNPNG